MRGQWEVGVPGSISGGTGGSTTTDFEKGLKGSIVVVEVQPLKEEAVAITGWHGPVARRVATH